MIRRIVYSTLVVAASAIVVGIALSRFDDGTDAAGGAPLLTAAEGSLRIANSKDGRAVFSASDMAPGETVAGKVRIANPNLIPFRMRVASDRPAPGPLGEAIRLTLKRGEAIVYRGPMSRFRREVLGTFPPEASRTYRFAAYLPRSAGNELQGTTTDLDLTWTATENAPPEACLLRAARARFFIFRAQPVIRFVTKYRATDPGKVRVVFFDRLEDDRLGMRLGAMTTSFGSQMESWGMERDRKEVPAGLVDQLRDRPDGFIARLYIDEAPDYCAERMNLVLSELRRVDRQYVWFQRGTFRTIRRPGGG